MGVINSKLRVTPPAEQAKEEVDANTMDAVISKAIGASVRKSSRIPVLSASYSYTYAKPRKYKRTPLKKEASTENCSKDNIGLSSGPLAYDSGLGLNKSTENSVLSLVR
ncbi:uncharacterized protein LOC108161458 [Drosophila miranda]|uniref:uncharacterized protein LOC108161458 n=1 Tax=Drosophila miranda TaxID=7229 RepID=UPI0007E77F3B|nr:uncharacterized protein LOC108161458 [Drosophila miranda]